MATNQRALHFVLKVANLKKSIEFFRDKLKMKVLRFEEFDQGCEAACNGPYDNKWSKTMIGYGPEDTHFVLELTYNYTIGKYHLGNDLQFIKLGLKEDLLKELSKEAEKTDDGLILTSPDGYKFVLSQPAGEDKRQDVTEVCLSTGDLIKAKEYWVDFLKMKELEEEKGKNDLVLKYSPEQASLRLRKIEEKLDHKSAYGRVAFSCPKEELAKISSGAEEAKKKVLTPLTDLDTPGKATVTVIILASEPDGHEICFVGDEGFRELSKVDPEANKLIDKSIAEDKSDEWYEKKKKAKVEA